MTRSLIEYSQRIITLDESTRDIKPEEAVMTRSEIKMLQILKECEITDSILKDWHMSLINLDPNLGRISWLRQTGLRRALGWATNGH